MQTQTIVHRANLRGGAKCGATGQVLISTSGATATVTCGDCNAETVPLCFTCADTGYQMFGLNAWVRCRDCGPVLAIEARLRSLA